MSSKSWYVLTSKAVPTRYGLSENIKVLFQALDQYYTGSIDDVELGRLVRLSPRRRAAIGRTITKCAQKINKEPEEVKTCVDIIEMCTELLEIADRCPPRQSFPFLRLPMEIRGRIIDLMVDNIFHTKGIVPASKSPCACPKLERGGWFQTSQMKALPGLLGPALNDEFFRIFFRKKQFRFRCTCELKTHLTRNPQLLEHVRHLVVHWCGTESVEAFKKLNHCPNLETLTVTISKATLAHLNERATLMKSYFPLPFKNTRIADVLGLDELLDVRGLKEVEVKHAQTRVTNLTCEMDRANVSELLSSRLTLPKQD